MQNNSKTYAERQKEAKARYIAEKTDCIKAYLPKGYAQKVEFLAHKMGISKAQVLRIAIDNLFTEQTNKQNSL